MRNITVKVIYAFFFIFFIFVGDIYAGESLPIVLFDQGHGQAFLIEREEALDLSSFANLFKEYGANVKASLTPITATLLSDTNVLVISGPFRSFSESEIIEIKKFIQRGGRVAIMIHVAPVIANLLNDLGVSFTNGPINEDENIIGGSTKDFVINRLENTAITDGLKGFNVYGAWGLIPQDNSVKIIAKTSPKAWIDYKHGGVRTGEFAIAVVGKIGNGYFVIFADDAIFQNRFLKNDNFKLGRNLVRWLLGK
jgi:hypothetical protein